MVSSVDPPVATAVARASSTAVAVAARSPQAPPLRRPRGLRKKLELTLLLGPALALFVGFVLAPIGIAVYYSLYNWSGFGPLSDFAGVHNYKLALSDPVFRSAIAHNLTLATLSVIIQLPLSIGLAMLLNPHTRGRSMPRPVAV